ncbi:MAG: hypothetical protein SGPRY_001817, partial [Prymnesium sp.]
LREGTHFLSRTLHLGAAHSHLSFVSLPGESPVLSGGVELTVSWQPYDVRHRNVWVTDVRGQVEEVPGLQIQGVRATRARYPNLSGGEQAPTTISQVANLLQIPTLDPKSQPV